VRALNSRVSCGRRLVDGRRAPKGGVPPVARAGPRSVCHHCMNAPGVRGGRRLGPGAEDDSRRDLRAEPLGGVVGTAGFPSLRARLVGRASSPRNTWRRRWNRAGRSIPSPRSRSRLRFMRTGSSAPAIGVPNGVLVVAGPEDAQRVPGVVTFGGIRREESGHERPRFHRVAGAFSFWVFPELQEHRR
jgi:hypothetical protein